MNLTLEQAMARATEGPLIAVSDERGVFIGKDAGRSNPMCVAPMNTSEKRTAKANAALLAHWYNVGPELVEKFAKIMNMLEYFPVKGDTSNQGAIDRYIQEAEAILARANTVTIPD